jgi:hypothetical protein
MLDRLQRKIRQMHAALGALSTDDLSTVQPQRGETATHRFFEVSFDRASNDVARANAASQVVANIASLKDHLRAWCRENGQCFTGEQLINSDTSVALIYDLWNIDKHAELNRPPRSGCTPSLRNITTALCISSSGEAGSGAYFSMNPATGKVSTGSAKGGSVALVLDAQIVDEHGSIKGDFREVCDQAAEAWLDAMKAAGVPLPPTE